MYSISVHSSGKGINGEGSFNDGFILLLNVYFEDWVSDIYVMIFFLKIMIFCNRIERKRNDHVVLCDIMAYSS